MPGEVMYTPNIVDALHNADTKNFVQLRVTVSDGSVNRFKENSVLRFCMDVPDRQHSNPVILIDIMGLNSYP